MKNIIVSNMEVEKTTRKGCYISGKNHKFGLTKDSDFIEVTQWSNGEGYTISICNELGNRNFEISWEELEGIKYLINRIDYD